MQRAYRSSGCRVYTVYTVYREYRGLHGPLYKGYTVHTSGKYLAGYDSYSTQKIPLQYLSGAKDKEPTGALRAMR